ncbi:MAG: hypothetical protein C4524_10260 [Candidatus Zixiibacteriota bacterium]|nr:MAG: hypothetical protein C4524_10260 [candidate division Zixibacteria bacterium]
MNRMYFLAAAALLAALLWGCSDLGDNAPTGGNGSAVDSVNFAREVLPILQTYCTSCHSGGNPSANLDLSSYAGIINAQSPSAPVVVPGNPDASPLVRRLDGTDPPVMPIGSPALMVSQVELIRAWIVQGALENAGTGTGGGGGGGGGGGTGGAISYVNHVQPILTSHCVACHASPASPSYGNLDLTSYAGLTSSSANHGPVIIAGDPNGSYLVKRINGTVAPLMPPTGSLTPQQVDLIEQWIAEGAVNDGGSGGGSGPVSYAADIQPLFTIRCVACHKPPNPEAGLDLTSWADLMAGAEGEEVIIPFNAAESELYQKLLPGEEERMPPGGPYLTEGQTGMIAEWINDGALNN